MCFYNFPRLPPEIQLYIWDIAVNAIDARIINVHIKQHPSKDWIPSSGWLEPDFQLSDVYLTASTPIPSLLHACHLSRAQAMTRFSPTLAIQPYLRPIWADVHADKVCIVVQDDVSGPNKQSDAAYRTVTLQTRHDEALRSFESIVLDKIPNVGRIRVLYEKE